MEIELFITEIKLFEIKTDNDNLILTDKRMICNDKFIGLNELRGADINTIPVTYEKIDIKDWDSVRKWSIIISGILSFIYLVYMMHPYRIVDYLGVTILSIACSYVCGLILAIPVVILLKIYIGASSKTIDRALLKIEKIDNSYFVNRYYDLKYLNELKEFVKQINSVIYK